MAIVADSSQWTGEYDHTPQAGPVVWGEFADRSTLDSVAAKLQAEQWFQAVQARAAAPQEQRPADNDQVITPDENPKGADSRNLRQNFVGIGTASTSMLAAGIVIATGGAALPAVAAAAAAGAATLAAGEVAGAAASPTDTGRRPEETLQTDGPSLGIQILTDEERAQAEAFLQSQGARRVWVQDQQAA
ncbi:hypothetical protein JMJ55_23305 [Belnapia sp. T6]|uniref:SPOR domain-containing protein n=1 Tax=Belnapia mucosa TaxID=2804532 RepID=A0ABS1V9E7_9PROT|nr:hypothetical protein [Belnapia mucosa]MBL6458270.1 hypothetical protein [Belnapia mucosa]